VRSSKKVIFSIKDHTLGNRLVKMNEALFNWVMENLIRNAIDAMSGKGDITLSIVEENEIIHLDIKDTGKGLTPQHRKRVFNPGVTSKKRGWGLGLTLSKRIIEEYHSGKIIVKSSKVNEGTTFRITLQRA
jgi:signal transduction histidine kinase